MTQCLEKENLSYLKMGSLGWGDGFEGKVLAEHA